MTEDLDLGTWLRRQRESRGWTRSELAGRLIKAGQARGDNMPVAESLVHNIYRWERGDDQPSERYKLRYCDVLGIQPAQYGPAGTPAPGMAIEAVPGPTAAPHLSRDPALAWENTALGQLLRAAVAYDGTREAVLGHSVIGQEVVMAAHEGSEGAERAEIHGIGDATSEQLRADVKRLALLTDAGEPLPVFLDLRRIRSRINRLLDRQLWPREQTELYFLLGCLNGLMGVNASRLGYPDAAEELLRAGLAWAIAIDHRPLLAQLRLQQSSVAYWRGGVLESRDLAASGLEYLSEGPGAAELHLKYARAVARLGDADGARRAVGLAHDAREQERRDDLLEIGGEFAISLATHHCYAGTALAEITETHGEAIRELETALSLYAAGPGPGEDHWFGGVVVAGIDLAAVRLRSGALDAAVAALERAWSLPPAQRVTSMTARFSTVRAELAAPVFRGSAQARELDERIEDFGRETIVSGLHGLAGGAD